eukprot:4457783-Prymnesium_polylepis.1
MSLLGEAPQSRVALEYLLFMGMGPAHRPGLKSSHTGNGRRSRTREREVASPSSNRERNELVILFILLRNLPMSSRVSVLQSVTPVKKV